MKQMVYALPLAALAAMIGCSSGPSPGSTMQLGTAEQVSPQLAFTTAKEVMAQYFPVQSADPESGTIKCQPAAVKERQERLLGASPTRQVASIQIFSSEGLTMATVTVVVQQLGTSVFRASRNEGSYSGVPNETPAQQDAATTAEQNQTWKTIDYSYETQRKILDDLRQRLHPESASQSAGRVQPPAVSSSPKD